MTKVKVTEKDVEEKELKDVEKKELKDVVKTDEKEAKEVVKADTKVEETTKEEKKPFYTRQSPFDLDPSIMEQR